ncbi:MAG: AarF/ABC1/UbiB kinase family protein [Pseudomonadota bacterium]
MSSRQKYSDKTVGSNIPAGRLSRFANMAHLTAGVAGSVVSEYAKQVSKGSSPQLKDLLLTPSNAKRVADKLMKMRGAALKMGQLLSMDSGEFIPPELALILEKLRDNVDPMPFSQLTQLLNNEWGNDWHENFKQFTFSPMAAASIGQVHSAYNLNGEKLAIKIQYPGISKSIDSDVDNVGTILKYSGLLPDITKIQNLLEETKHQLHQETDYLLESNWIETYQRHLANDQDFIVPQVFKEHTTSNILCMSHHDGQNIDTFTHLGPAEKNHIVSCLIKLTFKEIFELRHVQTDPNFANYLYQPETHRIVLLDFGATRKLPRHVSDGYKHLLSAATKDNKKEMDKAIEQIGFFQENITRTQRNAVLELFQMACEPFRHVGEYDFGNTNLARDVSVAGRELSFKQNYWHTPPADALFLHRKIAGLYLIAAKLKTNINIQDLVLSHL